MINMYIFYSQIDLEAVTAISINNIQSMESLTPEIDDTVTKEVKKKV